ncbi:unnamed protein product [Notodromas monacha]|uniref:Uncharacterized protein n=1 Tax=Notodromas monacha TaxID=399045 RepID=A0A7R9BFA3_9CRUS|nr:unnamed protein product [Notodromas monacha]CAG0914320.1 unnamed protein product [Notodromas monacha]
MAPHYRLLRLLFLEAFLLKVALARSISEIDYAVYEPKSFNIEKDVGFSSGDEGFEVEEDVPGVDVNVFVPVDGVDNDVANRTIDNCFLQITAKLIYRKNYRWWADHPEYAWLFILGGLTIFTLVVLFMLCICYYLVYRYFCIDLLSCDLFEEDIARYCADDAPTYPSKLQWIEDYCDKHRRCRDRGYV